MQESNGRNFRDFSKNCKRLFTVFSPSGQTGGYNKKRQTAEKRDPYETMQPHYRDGAVFGAACGRHLFCRRNAGRREGAFQRTGICADVRKLKKDQTNGSR